MEKKMYLVTQTRGEYEDRREDILLLTENLETAIKYKEEVDVDSDPYTVNSPMTYKEFKEYNEGYPDNWEKMSCRGNFDEAFDEFMAETAVDRGPYKAEDFILMRNKIEDLMGDPAYPCDIFEIQVDEPGSLKWLSKKDYGER